MITFPNSYDRMLGDAVVISYRVDENENAIKTTYELVDRHIYIKK